MQPAEQPGSPSRKSFYRALLTHADYRLLLASQLVSAIGDGVYAIALIWLMKELTGSALMMSILLAAEMVPLLVFGLFAGVLVDRGNKRKIMMLAEFVQGCVVALVAVLQMTGTLEPYMLIIAAIVLSSFGSFFSPARTVAVRTLVPEHLMTEAQSLAQLVQTVVGLIAPALGALLLHYDTAFAFMFNGASFLLSALLIWLIRNQELGRTSGEKLNLSGFVADFKEGVTAITSHTLLRSLMIYLVLMNFMFAPTILLFPLIANDSSELALLEISFFIGITAGVLLIGFFRKLPRIVTLVTGIGLMISGLGALYWMESLYIEAVCIFVAGLGSPLANVTLQTIFVLKVPREVLGRASSLSKVVLLSCQPVATLLTGALLAVLPVRAFFGIIGLCGLLVIGMMLLNPSIRKEGQQEPAVLAEQAGGAG